MSRSMNSGKRWSSELIAEWTGTIRRPGMRCRRAKPRAATPLRYRPWHSPSLQGDAGGVPEPALIMHVAVIWRSNKCVDRHARRHVGNVPSKHCADVEIAGRIPVSRSKSSPAGVLFQQERYDREHWFREPGGPRARRILASVCPRSRPGAYRHTRQKAAHPARRGCRQNNLGVTTQNVVVAGQQGLGPPRRRDLHQTCAVVGGQIPGFSLCRAQSP